MPARETIIIEEEDEVKESKSRFKGMEKIAITILVTQEEAIRLMSMVGAQLGVNLVSGKSETELSKHIAHKEKGAT